jgi:Na+-driven multidrug efflux pump
MEFTKASQLQVNISLRQIWKTTLPLSFAIFIPQVNFVANNIFLGHLKSGQSLAVAGLTGVYYLIFSAIGYGLNNGLQALISKKAGENDVKEIGILFGQGILISMIMALGGILFTWWVLPSIFKVMVLDESNGQMAQDFLSVRILGLPFLYLYQMRNALLVGINQSKYMILGTLAEVLANLFFDFVLIFGKLGFPELGFLGAAYGSVFAEITGVVVIFLVLKNTGI